MLKVLEQMEFQARSQIVLPMSSRNDIKREWRGVSILLEIEHYINVAPPIVRRGDYRSLM